MKWPLTALSIWFSLFTNVGSAVFEQPASGGAEYRGPGFVAVLPPGITGRTEGKVDFEMTTFSQADGRVLLSAYSGLHPNFGARAATAAKHSEEQINGMKARRLTWVDSTGNRCGEVLVALRSSGRTTYSAHLSYCLESESDVRMAEEIIKSIRPR